MIEGFVDNTKAALAQPPNELEPPVPVKSGEDIGFQLRNDG